MLVRIKEAGYYGHANYQPGELAGFSRALAQELIRRGRAETAVSAVATKDKRPVMIGKWDGKGEEKIRL